jgi:hypothetical protein
MASGYEFKLALNSSQFKKGSDEAADSLEEVVDAFTELEKSGADSVDDVAKAFKEVGDEAKDAGKEVDNKFTEKVEDAGKEADDLEKKYRDAFDNAAKSADNSGDRIRKSSKDSFDKAKEGADEFKDSARQSAEEAASSFDGSLEGIADSAQEILSEAFAGFGPAGAAAGLAAAAGIGLLIAGLQNAADEANATKDKVIDLATQIHEVDCDLNALDWGQIFQDFGNEIADPKSWFEPWQDANKTNYELVKELAEKSGVEYSKMFQGMAGDQDQAASAMADLNDKIEAQQEVVDGLTEATGGLNTAHGKANAAERDRLKSLTDIRDQLQESSGLTDQAIEHERLMSEAYEGSTAEINDKNDALRETIELNGEVIGSELDYLDTLDEATQKLQENTEAGFDKNTAAGRDNLRALGDISAATLDYSDSIVEAGGSQIEANAVIGQGREELIRAAEQLGMTKEQAEQYANSLGLIPKDVNTKANAQTQEAEEKLQHTARDRSTTIIGEADGYQFQSAVDAAAARIVKPRIGFNMVAV